MVALLGVNLEQDSYTTALIVHGLAQGEDLLLPCVWSEPLVRDLVGQCAHGRNAEKSQGR